MSILMSNEIINAVIEELSKATSSVQIITAYCKKKTFEKLNDVIPESVHNRQLIVRLRLDDIISGSTDFEILEYGITHGWRIYIRFDLHAKTYIFDNKRGLIGSANVTNSGLKIGKIGNMEMATIIDIEPEDLEKINRLYIDAIQVNDEIINIMKLQLASVKKEEKHTKLSWNKEITSKFNPCITTLFSYEFPDVYEFTIGEYFSFMDYTYLGDIEELKENFRWSNAFLWLLNIVKNNNGEIYFGGITEKLHNSLVTDPKPYRRDVKQMLSNLLDLIEKLGMEEVIIDRPNHSQRVRINNHFKRELREDKNG